MEPYEVLQHLIAARGISQKDLVGVIAEGIYAEGRRQKEKSGFVWVLG